MYDLIEKKRNGQHLSTEEINYIVQGYVKNRIPDYQVSAFLMAVYFRGMSFQEMADLTSAIAASGDRLDLSSIPGIKVDKHSSGGVGDKTTLVLAPLVASVGLPVAKMSGRALGYTGGTIDKLESIPGFKTEIPYKDFVDQVRKVGVAVVAQTGHLAPADKKLYALRDVTATVDSIPLIASSIMSKKLAAGADAILLDVKTGSGAFLKEIDESLELARAMVKIGSKHNVRTVAIVTNMDQPLGYAVGNALEVKEAIAVLRNSKQPGDLRELCLALGSQMLILAGRTKDTSQARALLEEALDSGAALEKFTQWVAAQGGDARIVDDDTLLPCASRIEEVTSPQDGFVHSIAAREVGRAALLLGAGRETKNSRIDPAVGIVMRRKAGDHVRQGETLALIHANQKNMAEAKEILLNSYTISNKKPPTQPLLYYLVQDDIVIPL